MSSTRRVDYADRAKDAFQRMVNCTTHADALYQAGNIDGAVALFAEAERLQAEDRPDLTKLISLRGYQYRDLLLGVGRAAEAREQAEYALDLSNRFLGRGLGLLDIALDTLSLGRAAHALASAPHPPHSLRADLLAEARRTLDGAVDGLRKAGQEQELPRGLLARAACLRDMGEWAAAARDLKETREIAERGEMRLFLSDWHLESAAAAGAVGVDGVRPCGSDPRGTAQQLVAALVWFGRVGVIRSIEG